MGLFEILHIFIISLYALGTVLFLTGSGTGNERLKRIAIWMAVIGFVLNTADLALVSLNNTAALKAGTFYINILAWCVLALYFFLWWRLRLEYLAITALPLALLLFIASLALGGIRVVMPPELTLLFFFMHIASLILTLGVLIMAFGAGIAFIYYNRKLKTKAGLKSMGKDVPSLDKFDTVNRWGRAPGLPALHPGAVLLLFLVLDFAGQAFCLGRHEDRLPGRLVPVRLPLPSAPGPGLARTQARHPGHMGLCRHVRLPHSPHHHFPGDAMNRKIILIGLNHRTAGVEIREKFALTDVEHFEKGLMAHCPIYECMALSTCNRVEIIAVTKKRTGTRSHELIGRILGGRLQRGSENTSGKHLSIQ